MKACIAKLILIIFCFLIFHETCDAKQHRISRRRRFIEEPTALPKQSTTKLSKNVIHISVKKENQFLAENEGKFII